MHRSRWKTVSGYVMAAGLLALAAAWVASGPLTGAGQPETRKPPASLDRAGEIPAVRVRDQRAAWHREVLTAQGRTEPHKRITVRAEAEGRIIALPVEKGDTVRAGTLLARIDPQDKPARLKEAEARLAQRRAELDAAEKLSEKGFRARTQLARAEAEYEQAEAQVRQAEVALAQTRIVAAFDGRLGEVTVETGDYMSPGDAVLDLIDLDPIRLVASVSERNVDRLSLGQAITATTVNGRKLDATLTYIAAEAAPETRTFTVEAEAGNTEGAVRAGVTVNLTLPLEARRAHFISPSILTLAADGTVGVKVLDADNVIRFEPVHVIADTPEGVWVGGLPETVTLVTVGQDFVDTGETVRPTREGEVAPATAEAGGPRAVTDSPVNGADRPGRGTAESEP
jgi:multidrug efflux system membrane fusion protein